MLLLNHVNKFFLEEVQVVKAGTVRAAKQGSADFALGPGCQGLTPIPKDGDADSKRKTSVTSPKDGRDKISKKGDQSGEQSSNDWSGLLNDRSGLKAQT